MLSKQQWYQGRILAVLALCVVLLGMTAEVPAAPELKVGAITSAGSSSQSTLRLCLFVGQSTPIGPSQCPAMRLCGGMGYAVDIPGEVTAVSDDVSLETVPQAYALYPNVPNPFNPNTVIKYDLREGARVSLSVYDILGRRVRILEDRVQQAGHHSTVWDGCDDSGRKVASGVYLCSLRAGTFSQTGKMVLMK